MKDIDFGLDSLALELEADSTAVLELQINQVSPDPEQPRTYFDQEKIEKLAESIAAQGVLQPIIVREDSSPDHYIIIAGERRWRAAKLAKLATIPSIIKNAGYTEIVAAQIIENIDREDFTLRDEVAAVMRMCEISGSAKAAGEALGKPKTWISQRVKIGKGGKVIDEFIQKGNSTDTVGTYQLARLSERYPEAAKAFIQNWIENPQDRGNLREKVASLFEKMDEKVNATNSVTKPKKKTTSGKTSAPKKKKPAKILKDIETVVDFEIKDQQVILQTKSKTIALEITLLQAINEQL